MQGGPPSHAPTEPAPGSVSAAAGANDESSGEDDSDSLSHISGMESQWRQRSREIMNMPVWVFWARAWFCFIHSMEVIKTSIKNLVHAEGFLCCIYAHSSKMGMGSYKQRLMGFYGSILCFHINNSCILMICQEPN